MRFLTFLCLLLFCVFFSTSCGEKSAVKEGHTRVIFNRGGEKAVLNGGLLVYIQDQLDLNAKGALYLSDESGSSSNSTIELPNGQFTFTAIGYDSASNPLQSNSIYCGFANSGQPVTLTGGTQIVTIHMYPMASDLTCASPPFNSSSYASGNYFQAIRIVNCTDILPSANLPFVGCSSEGSSDGGFTSASHSFKFSLVAYKPSGPAEDPFSSYTIEDTPLKTTCETFAVGGITTPAPDQFLPVGDDDNSPYWVRAEIWTGGSCSGTPIHTFDFSNGLHMSTVGSNGGTGVIADDSTYTFIQLQGGP